jgi:hypothetical protein
LFSHTRECKPCTYLGIVTDPGALAVSTVDTLEAVCDGGDDDGLQSINLRYYSTTLACVRVRVAPRLKGSAVKAVAQTPSTHHRYPPSNWNFPRLGMIHPVMWSPPAHYCTMAIEWWKDHWKRSSTRVPSPLCSRRISDWFARCI